ncbi:Tic20 family protein, partial [Spirulina sp. 06S082]|uniref:Tic20 family protein n=1 Tax=Spirulina sp. 06S082 TaxID=3110248 RepID=UPI002B1FACC5
MVRRGSTTTQDKILAALTYLIPIIEALPFGMLVFSLVPPLAILFTPLFILMPIYFLSIGGLAIVEFGIFFAVYVLVIQNQTLPHFLRFNALQALLISIAAYLCRLVLELLGLSQQLLDPLVGRSTPGVSILPENILSTA